MTTPEMTVQITPISQDTIQSFRDAFEQDLAAKASQNAVTQTTIDDVAMVRDVVQGTDFSFSTHLDDWKVANQKKIRTVLAFRSTQHASSSGNEKDERQRV